MSSTSFLWRRAKIETNLASFRRFSIEPRDVTDFFSYSCRYDTVQRSSSSSQCLRADLLNRLDRYGMVWGVLLSSLRRDHYPNTSLATLTLIAGLQNLFQNLAPFISGRLGEKFGFKRMIAIGSIASVCFLIFSGLAVESLPALFVVQGALLGLCHGISLPLVGRNDLCLSRKKRKLISVSFDQFMTLPSQWFSRRRGLATGITVSGTGFGGGVYSLIMRAILPKLGYRNSLFVR